MDFSLKSKIRVELNRRFAYSIPIKIFFMLLSLYSISVLLNLVSHSLSLPFKFDYSHKTIFVILISFVIVDFIKFCIVCNQRSFNSVLDLAYHFTQNYELLIVFPIWLALNVVIIYKLISICTCTVTANQPREILFIEVGITSLIKIIFFLTDKSNFSLAPTHVRLL